MEFTTAKRRLDPIPFTLDGRDFSFVPPKSALMVMPVLDADADDANAETRATFDWLGAGLADGDVEYLKGRLRDLEDDFDIDDLSAVIEYLTKTIAGRPTT